MWKSSHTTTLAAYNYTFDLVGNRLSAVGSGNSVAERTIGYEYDGLHRLTTAEDDGIGAENFRYDLLGNRDGDGTGGVYGYSDSRSGGNGNIAYGANNDVNEYASIGGQTVMYDAAGNLVRDEAGVGYSYDFENRLVRTFDDADTDGLFDSGSEDKYLEFAYDALGRRIELADWTLPEHGTTNPPGGGSTTTARTRSPSIAVFLTCHCCARTSTARPTSTNTCWSTTPAPTRSTTTCSRSSTPWPAWPTRTATWSKPTTTTPMGRSPSTIPRPRSTSAR